MPDDFNMEADAAQAAPIDPQTMKSMEREQRKAYWKGEEAASHRLPQFLPQDPISGAVLRESERIEEAVWAQEQEALEAEAWAAEDAWNAEVQAQGMVNDQDPPTVEQPANVPEGVDVQGARESLAAVNRWGGETDDNAVDQFVIQVAGDMRYGHKEQRLGERPRYEQKAEFYKWVRKMESWSKGEEAKDHEYRATQPSEEEKHMQRQNKGRHPSRPLANELPEGQSIG